MSLFSSNLIFSRITDITPEILKSIGVGTLLLDIDNTLSTHHGTVLIDGVSEWIDNMKKNGIGMIIVSNSKRFRVEPFAKRLGLPFVSLALKPLPSGYRKGIRMLCAQKKDTAIIGDQLFTDVLGANLFGVKSVLVRPIKPETGLSFRIRRFFEKKILKDRF